MNKVLTSIIAVIWLSAGYCYGQNQQSTELLLYFKGGSSKVDPDYMGNRVTLSRIAEILTPNNVQYFESIDITGYASPEGISTVNDRLAAERAAAVKLYIAPNYPYLPQGKITTRGAGVDWNKLRELVEADKLTPNREKILYIIDNVPATINVKTNTSRKKSLMDLGVPTWSYMLNNHFPLMRVGASMTVTLMPDTPTEVQEAMGRMPHIAPEIVSAALTSNVSPEEMAVITTKLDSINTLLSRIDRSAVTTVPQNNLERVKEMIQRTEKQMELTKELRANNSDEQINRELGEVDSLLQDIYSRLLAIRERLVNGTPIEEQKVVVNVPQLESHTVIKKPLFALKTNLLFDAASLINVELEVPIGKRWSIAGEWIFPWWLWENKQHCLQIGSGNIEGRYWFGNRENRPLLTGWFAGLYAGGGYYDLEWDKKGYQGEFFIASGISGGYVHAINKAKTLRMEYSLGIGYMQTKYRRYEAMFSNVDDQWHLIRQQNGHYTWIGPTRAKVSLVWMINRNVKKGGAK